MKFTIYTVKDIQKKLKCSSYTAYKRASAVTKKYKDRWLLSKFELAHACRIKLNQKMSAAGRAGAAAKTCAMKKKKKKKGC